jgi:hypothetical protein
MRRLRLSAFLLSVGCAAPVPESKPAAATAPGPFAAPTELAATLLTPLDIELRWKDNATNEGGYFVEGYYVGHAPTSQEFVIIESVPPDTTSYRHTKLLPETRFVYRVRPFFGRASSAAEIVTGKEGPPQVTVPEPTRATPVAGAVRASLRSVETEALAAPTDFRATLLPPTGVKLEWKDHAGNEDEYLIEVRSPDSEGFKPSTFEPADTTAWVSYNFDPESRFVFRVRAFVYGEPSNAVELTTGTDPSMPPGKWKPGQ